MDGEKPNARHCGILRPSAGRLPADSRQSPPPSDLEDVLREPPDAAQIQRAERAFFWRSDSYKNMEAATFTFRLSDIPPIGILTFSASSASQSAPSPSDSLPTTMATGRTNRLPTGIFPRPNAPLPALSRWISAIGRHLPRRRRLSEPKTARPETPSPPPD